MSEEGAKYAEALLKASDIMMRLIKDGLTAVPIRDYQKSDGSHVYVYAHYSGVVELEKTVSGDLMAYGMEIGKHRDIKNLCEAALQQLVLQDDKSVDDIVMKSDKAMKLRKAINRSVGVLDAVTAYMNRPGPKPSGLSEDEQHLETQANKKRLLGRASRYRDSKVEDEPKYVPRAKGQRM